MTPMLARRVTIEDLYKITDKAELINGKIVYMSPAGGDPGYAGDEVFVSLREYTRDSGDGRAVSGNKGFHVELPNRESFSPDAALYRGPNPGMRFFDGAPAFAVEVRSESDYGSAAERAMEEKRRDYFAAGTQVVWDVDLLGQDVVRKFTAPDATVPSENFRRGETANAEPAVPGWRIEVDALFAPDGFSTEAA